MMLVGILLGFVAGLLLFVAIGSTQHFNRDPGPADPEPLPPPSAGASWDELVARAERVVEGAQAELPDDIRAEAALVPTLFQEWHATRDRILGVYYNTRSTDQALRKGPIVLYLRAIESYARQVRVPFDDQVRATYLHELGHHVGWNEGQVQERGL